MGIPNWSRGKVVAFWLAWLAFTIVAAVMLGLIEVRYVRGEGRALGLRIQWAGTIAFVALAVPLLLTLYWRRARS
jgi:hypothetical protein